MFRIQRAERQSETLTSSLTRAKKLNCMKLTQNGASYVYHRYVCPKEYVLLLIVHKGKIFPLPGSIDFFQILPTICMLTSLQIYKQSKYVKEPNESLLKTIVNNFVDAKLIKWFSMFK